MHCTTPHDFIIPSTKFRFSFPIANQGRLSSFYIIILISAFEVLGGEIQSRDQFKTEKEKKRKIKTEHENRMLWKEADHPSKMNWCIEWWQRLFINNNIDQKISLIYLIKKV